MSIIRSFYFKVQGRCCWCWCLSCWWCFCCCWCFNCLNFLFYHNVHSTTFFGIYFCVFVYLYIFVQLLSEPKIKAFYLGLGHIDTLHSLNQNQEHHSRIQVSICHQFECELQCMSFVHTNRLAL